MLERALTQGMTDFVVRGGDGARADLMVFVNSAAAASEGKQMMDLLQGKEYGPGAEVRPLFLSISSLGDAATRSAMPIGHGPSSLGYTLNGSWRTYKTPDQWGVTSQRDYYMSTTAHMPQLQSHLVVDLDDQARCGRIVRGPVGLPNGRQYVVCEKPGRLNTTPYWAMQMPAAIVRDHSGIFNANFIDLLMMFFPPAEELRTPVEQREPLLRPAR